MRLLLLPLLLLPLVALGAIAIAVVTARAPGTPGTRPDVETSPAAYARARRHAAVVAGVSWAALLVVAVTLPQTIPFGPDQGIVLGCAPAVAGVVALLVAAVGERTWPRPADPVRRASLARRTIRDVTPHAPTMLTTGWSAALLLVLLATGLTAAPDDGRSLVVRHGADATSGAGPYPGPPYGVPIAASVVLLLVATLLTLHLVATRPAVPQVSTADDVRLRRAGARRVLAAAQLAVGSTLAGVLLVTGTALRNASTSGYDAGEGWVASTDPVVHALGVAGLVAAPVVLVATLVVTGVALTRASQETAPDRMAAVPA